jgi:hypothetical protein
MFEQISSGSFMAQDADEAGPIAVEEQFFEQDIEKKIANWVFTQVAPGDKDFQLDWNGKNTWRDIFVYG